MLCVLHQLLRITPAERSREYVLLSFLEHQSCECRPRRHHLRNQQSKGSECSSSAEGGGRANAGGDGEEGRMRIETQPGYGDHYGR
ncbi:hypothetical protein cypCar_00042644 [Cyprinus carpio]|nr:hypothetical protein cypCar_00042644 [Cyprinus carpio]